MGLAQMSMHVLQPDEWCHLLKVHLLLPGIPLLHPRYFPELFLLSFPRTSSQVNPDTKWNNLHLTFLFLLCISWLKLVFIIEVKNIKSWFTLRKLIVNDIQLLNSLFDKTNSLFTFKCFTNLIISKAKSNDKSSISFFFPIIIQNQ
jgi:hypothetical protein